MKASGYGKLCSMIWNRPSGGWECPCWGEWSWVMPRIWSSLKNGREWRGASLSER